MNGTGRSQVQRLPERGSQDPAVIKEVLDAAFVAHVGFHAQSQTFVIPMIYGRDDDILYLHGATSSRLLGTLTDRTDACVTVTIIDGLVLARSAFHHSVNYRSVVAFGTARALVGAATKLRAMQVISEHLLAGRWRDVRGPTRAEVDATSVIEFTITEASAKIRTGPPVDDDEDYGRPTWAGVLPFKLQADAPMPDPRLAADIAIPQYLVSRRNAR
jgi:nitroimidazol reductase NimA-like FMN-containing flavoprotein (pyridoxamine 5'-phosphate oxidase superfamily)